jgi:hypothetical protein
MEVASKSKAVESKNYVKGSSCLCGGRAAINQHIGTPVVYPLVVMAPKHVLVPHRANNFIVNVKPNFPATAVSVRVEHVDRIVPAARELAVVV